jgi:hypothetical protein
MQSVRLVSALFAKGVVHNVASIKKSLSAPHGIGGHGSYCLLALMRVSFGVEVFLNVVEARPLDWNRHSARLAVANAGWRRGCIEGWLLRRVLTGGPERRSQAPLSVSLSGVVEQLPKQLGRIID